MRPSVIDAWMNDISQSLSFPPDSYHKRPYDESTVIPESPRKRRAVLGQIDPDITISKHQQSRPLRPKRSTRTPSPVKPLQDDFQEETPRQARLRQPRPLPPHSLPQLISTGKNSYWEELATTEEEEGGPLSAPSILSDRSINTDLSAKSQRSTSPIKRVAALRDVAGGIFYQKLSDNGEELGTECKTLFLALKDIETGIGIFPDALFPHDTLLAQLGKTLRPHHKHKTDRSRQELGLELNEVGNIVQDSQRCSSRGETEAHWNMAVHGPLLRLALGRDEAVVGYKYVPGDKINPRWLPPHSSGLAAGSKIVDFVIFLGNGNNDDAMQANLINLTPNISCSINHISLVSLQRCPIAINIETKTISRTEEEARIQLGIWVSSQIRRIQALVKDTEAQAAVLTRMVFPLVFVHSDHWSVMFARPIAGRSGGERLRPRDLDKLEIYTDISLGNTGTIFGTYRLLQSLRALRTWTDDTFRKWWKELIAA